MFGWPFWRHFPFGHPFIHKMCIDVSGTTGIICSPDCTGAATPPENLRKVFDSAGRPGATGCESCASLLTDPRLVAVAASAKNTDEGVQKLQKSRITFAQLEQTSERRKRARDATSLVALGDKRRLTTALGRVEVHDELLHAMADGNVPRLSALVAAALRAGRGPKYIARTLALAKANKYRPKDFSMAERDIMLLVGCRQEALH
jgi:hypothetical protein